MPFALLLLVLFPLLPAVSGSFCGSGDSAALQCLVKGAAMTREDLALCTESPLRIRSLSIVPQSLLSSVAVDTFANFTLLRCLRLTGLNLTALPGALFADLLPLERLDLSANQLQALPAGLFDSVLELRILNLAANQLTELDAAQFANSFELQSLDLSANRLTTLPDDLFRNLRRLERLDLSSNRLTTLPDNLFVPFDHLNRLDLSANQLTVLSAHPPPRWPLEFVLLTAENPIAPCWSFNGTHLTPPSDQWWWCSGYGRIVTGIYKQANVVIEGHASAANGSAAAVLVWHSPRGFLYAADNATVWRHRFGLIDVSTVRVVPLSGDLQIAYFRSYFAGLWSLLRVRPGRAGVAVVTRVMVQCRSYVRSIYLWSLIVSGACTAAMLLAGLLTALIRLLINTRCFTRKILVVSALSLEDLQYSPRTQRKRLYLVRNYEANRAALLANEARALAANGGGGGAGGDPPSGTASLLTSTAGSLDGSTPPDSPPPAWLPPHRLAAFELFSQGGASETEPETPPAVDSEPESDTGEAGPSWWRVEELSERLRAGMSRHVDQVRLRMREQRLNMEESTSRMMRQLRSGSQVAALKMRSGLVNSMDVVRWKVRNITELCGGGTANLGQTVSVSTLVTDMDTQTTTSRRVVDVTAV